MAVIEVNGCLINDSISNFHCLQHGKLDGATVGKIVALTKQFETTADPSLVVEILSIAGNGSILFPLRFAFDVARKNARASKIFADTVDVFPADFDRVKSYLHQTDLPRTTHPYVRRILHSLFFSTTLSSISGISEEFWTNFVLQFKNPDTQWKSTLNFNEQHKRGFSKLAEYLNANFPTSCGYDKPVKVKRRAAVGRKTGKSIESITNPPPNLVKWVEILTEYRSGPRLAKTTKYSNNAFLNFASWLDFYPDEARSDPEVFLSSPRTSPSWVDHVVKCGGGTLMGKMVPIVNYMTDMVDWFIEENMVVVEGEDRISYGHALLTNLEKKQFENRAKAVSAGKPTQTTSAFLPRRLVKIVQQILTEDNWAWPKLQQADYVTINVNGNAKQVWNPVVAYLIYTLTELPWRKIQVKCLDSGEGDALRYNVKSDTWVKNRSAGASYWENEITAKRKARGILNSEHNDFCFYVSTNKTSDRQHGFGEMSGYYVPWKYTPMIKIFDELRRWQEKHNPLPVPTPYSDVMSSMGADAPPQKVVEQIPDRFYLFRDMNGAENRVSPPTDNRIYSFWRLLMDELEKRLRDRGDETIIIKSRNTSGGPATTFYPVHGLRVSGLTAFAEAGVPIEILSKLVAGHASILMTIYYLKYTSSHVTDLLDEARLRIEANASKEFVRHLREMNFQQASKLAVANESYTLEKVAEGKIQTELFHDTGLGICPFAGSRCGDGIDLGNGRTEAVPGGAKNCLRCRHFITGEPWLVPLVLHQQKLSADSQSLSQKHNDDSEHLDSLETERARICKSKGIAAVPLELNRAISQLESTVERDAENLDFMLNTMHAADRLIEGIKKLQSSTDDQDLPILVSETPFRFGEYREGTRFELIDSVLQGSRIYPILRDEGFELERERYIDAILYHNSLTPLSMMTLTKEQKKRAADAASEWLLRKVGACETELLISGAQTLQELGFEHRDIQVEIKKATLSIEDHSD
ncbi:VPA1269 family protein [Ruegeria sp. EL01]|uniref:VPA1269 family protein n=1 Tax=Ruegeria sp. EL01 TaxID=2107578 RepID=UPI000EA80C7F|nr:VPA1269 family protein [Ruegeria sp. EL01]